MELKRILCWLGILLVLLGCSDTASTGLGADSLAPEDLPIDLPTICPGAACQSSNDCEMLGPCTRQIACEQGCCSTDFEPEGTPCALPCQTGGSCNGSGECLDLQPLNCPDLDGNPCTLASCDAKSGECQLEETAMEDGAPPFTTACWEGIVCTDGAPDTTHAVPTALQQECQQSNDALTPFGCTDQVVCLDSEGTCATLYKPASTPCWVSAGSTGTTCFGRSCDGQGECVADPERNVTCTADTFPNQCGEECLACTDLSCHWIPDPAKPQNPSTKVAYCKPQALVGVGCSDDNDCTANDSCIFDSEAQGPLGKETLGVCQPGAGKTKEDCLADLELPPLPCLKKGVSCSPEDGCNLDQEVADQWCYPPPSVCFDQDGTFCTHIDLKDGLWDPETGCHLELVDDSSCDDANGCTDDECDPAEGCLHINNSAPCSDGNLCTLGDSCAGGACQPGAAALDCDDGDPCTVDSCDALAGCLHTASNGQPCDDDDPCTGDGICVGGMCSAGESLDCSDGNDCTLDLCDALLGCQNPPNTAPCNDGNACTENDACAEGQCTGQPTSNCCGNGQCEAGEACTCTADCLGTPCDNDECIAGQSCQANGQCGGGQPIDDCCGNGVCSAAELCDCVVDCAGSPCDDGNPDTSGDLCTAGGQCQGSTTTCGPIGKSSTGALGDLSLTGAVTIDTTSGTITAGGNVVVSGNQDGVELITQDGNANGFSAPKLRVYHFATLTVASGCSVTVTGQHGLALLTQGKLDLLGSILANGSAGTSGGTNSGGLAGSPGPAGHAGGQWTSGLGCVGGNGAATGPGPGQEGSCGGSGNDGGKGYSGGGGGGGGGGCGGTGGGGGGHGTPGQGGVPGLTATAGTGGATPGNPGALGPGCSSTQPSGGSTTYGDGQLSVLFGGTGGSGGGFGGFAGFGGWGVGDGGTGYGGAPGFSGGAGGGGGGGGVLLLCAASELQVAASGKLEVHGGNGGSGGGSGISESGKSSSFGSGPIGGGGGGGRSGGGGGGGGGAGGAILLAGGTVKVFGNLHAGGGIGGSGGWSGSGGFGGGGKNGGGNGGKGGNGGTGGKGGDGGLGYIRLDADVVVMQGSYTGQLSQ